MSVAAKVFASRNRRGNMQVNVREHYLRNDLPCGVGQCPTCPVRSLHSTALFALLLRLILTWELYLF